MNIGGYEIIHPVKEKTPDTRYVMVTDDPGLKDESGTWEILYDPTLTGTTIDKCWQVRWARRWEYAGDSDILVQVDGSVGIESDFSPIVDAFRESNAEMGIMLHPTRLRIYDEYVAWVQQRNYPIKQAERCLSRIVSCFGIPVDKDLGFAQMCWMISRRTTNTLNLGKMMYGTLWYIGGEEIERLDQTVFTALVLRMYPDMPLWIVDNRLYQSKYFLWYPHHSDKPFIPLETSQMCKATWGGKRIMTNINNLYA